MRAEERKIRQGCLRAPWNIPIYVRLAIIAGIGAGSLTGMAIEYWLLEMKGIPFASPYIAIRIAVIIVPAILVFGIITLAAALILRPRK